MPECDVDKILLKCRSVVNSDSGFEIYPFKVIKIKILLILKVPNYNFQIGWYNDKVVKQFQLPYSYDTLSVIVVSQPCMFEKTFLPWLIENQHRLPDMKDFIDECMQCFFTQIKQVIVLNCESLAENQIILIIRMLRNWYVLLCFSCLMILKLR